MIFLDVETFGLNPRKDPMHGCATAQWENPTYARSPVIQDTSWCGHNIRFDASFLSKLTRPTELIDTLALCQLLDDNAESLGLKEQMRQRGMKEQLRYKEMVDAACARLGLKHVGELCRYDAADEKGLYREIISRYCEEDVENTRTLYKLLLAQLEAASARMQDLGYQKTLRDYWREETVPLDMVLFKAEERGIRIDVPRLQRTKLLLKRYERLILRGFVPSHPQLKLVSPKGFNHNSTKQVGKLLYDVFNLPVLAKTEKGAPSTDDDTLRQLAYMAKDGAKLYVEGLRKLRSCRKLLSTYIGDKKGLSSCMEDGRVFPTYRHGGGPVTGRLSSAHPNVQNLPRAGTMGDRLIKKLFIPDEGQVFIYFDYSQIELRVAAHLSQDRVLCQYYKEGKDVHALTASSIFEKSIEAITKQERQVGKTINFATIYDAGPFRLSDILEGKYSMGECSKFKAAFFNTYQDYKLFLDKTKEGLKERGYIVTPFGRVRRLPELLTLSPKDAKYRHALKQGLNFVVQSTAASITKRAMIALDKAGFNVVTQVHDSVIISYPRSEIYPCAEIQRIAEKTTQISVPLVAECKVLASFDESDVIK